MNFKVGDKAVVPGHGVGVIKEVENITMDGETLDFYVIKILDNGLTWKCPTDRTEENGLREVISISSIADVYEVLSEREKPPDKQTWNRRYREYMNRIKTGEPLEVAHVLRDLAILRSEKTLSFGERKMYDQAHGLIVQEIAVARDIDEDEVKKELTDLFAAADLKGGAGVKKKVPKKK